MEAVLMDLLTSTDKKKDQLVDEQIAAGTGAWTLVEGTKEQGTEGRVFARGEFGHMGKPTANGRWYKKPIWEGNISRLQSNLESKKVLGELDHPSDGRTALQRASHVITDLRLEGERVIGEAEILDTAKGRDLKAILAAGVPVGISSRGYGSTKPDGKGNEIVQEDYKLVTFDFVAEPADDTAYPEAFFEGVEIPMELTKDQEQKMADEFAQRVVAARKEGEESAEKTLRDEFAATLLSKLGEMRDELKKEVQAEMLADPGVAGAKEAMDRVREVLRPFVIPEDVNSIVEEKDVEIRRLRKQLSEAELRIQNQDDVIEKLKNAAKEAGYKFHLERIIHEDEEAVFIRQLVGDVTQYESPKALEAKVEEAREEIQTRRVQEEKVQERLHARENSLRDKNHELAEGLEKAMTVNRELALRLYASKRLTNHPKGSKIMRMLERAGVESQEQIDDLIEDFREPARDADDLESVRNRVRTRLGGSGREYLPEEESSTSSRRSGTGNYNGLGVSLAELKHLSRIRD
jgi:hypothetical protein